MLSYVELCGIILFVCGVTVIIVVLAQTLSPSSYISQNSINLSSSISIGKFVKFNGVVAFFILYNCNSIILLMYVMCYTNNKQWRTSTLVI